MQVELTFRGWFPIFPTDLQRIADTLQDFGAEDEAIDGITNGIQTLTGHEGWTATYFGEGVFSVSGMDGDPLQ